MFSPTRTEAELQEIPREVVPFRTFTGFNDAQASFTGRHIPEDAAAELELMSLSWQRIRDLTEIGSNVSEDNLPKVFYGARRERSDLELPAWRIPPIPLAEAKFRLVVSPPDEQQQRVAQLIDGESKLRLTYNPKKGWRKPNLAYKIAFRLHKFTKLFRINS